MAVLLVITYPTYSNTQQQQLAATAKPPKPSEMVGVPAHLLHDEYSKLVASIVELGAFSQTTAPHPNQVETW